jgi:hypothetical protein
MLMDDWLVSVTRRFCGAAGGSVGGKQEGMCTQGDIIRKIQGSLQTRGIRRVKIE